MAASPTPAALRLDRRLPSLYPLSHSAAARGKSRRRRRYYWSPPLEIRVHRRLRERPDTRIPENGFDAVGIPNRNKIRKPIGRMPFRLSTALCPTWPLTLLPVCASRPP